MDELEYVKQSPRHQGQKELIAFLEGQHITHKQRILAYCYRCMGNYADGFIDCENPTCPLYGVVRGRK